MAEVDSLVIRITADMAQLRRELKRAERTTKKSGRAMSQSMDKFGKSIKGNGDIMAAFGRRLGVMAVAAAAAGVALASIRRELKFSQTMSRITGLVGVAAAQVNKWKDELKDLSNALGVAPQELAEGLFFITSAGLRGTKAIKALNAAAKASVAGLGSVKVVADALTSALNAYGDANLTAEKSASILVATVREGKAEADAIAGALGQVLPVAAELEVSFDQVGAAIAAMTRVGLDANISVTALRSTLSAILKPSSQAAKVAKDMEFSFDLIRKSLREKGLLATLRELKVRLAASGQTMEKLFPDVRALTAVLTLVGKNAEAVEGIFKSLASEGVEALANAYGVAAEEPMQKFVKAQIRINNAIDGLTDASGIIGGLTSLLDGLASAAESVSTAVDAMRASLSTFESAEAAVVDVEKRIMSLEAALEAAGENRSWIENILEGRGAVEALILAALPAPLAGMFITAKASVTEMREEVERLKEDLADTELDKLFDEFGGESVAKFERDVPDDVDPAAGGGDKATSKQQKALAAVEASIAAINAETVALGLNKKEREVLSAQLEIGNKLTKAGIFLREEEAQELADRVEASVMALQAQQATNDALESFRDTINSAKSEQELYNETIARWLQLQKDGLITTPQLAEATEALRKKMEEARNKTTLVKTEMDLARDATRRFSDTMVDAFSEGIQRGDSFIDVLKNVALSISKIGVEIGTSGLKDMLAGRTGGEGQTQGSAFGGIAKFIGGLFASSFQTGGSGNLAASANFGGGDFKLGGKVGGRPGNAAVSPVFAGAPRFQAGGIVGLSPKLQRGEVPIIAHKGETVLTAAQTRSMNSGGERPISIVMQISTPNADSFRANQDQIVGNMSNMLRHATRNE